MNDRDHFAAAALTGLVGECGYHSPEDVAREAYALADAMLRERERTTLDPEPAGKAAEPESSVPLGSGAALATQEPVGWVAFAADGSESSAVYSLYEQARAAADEWNWCIAPLYRQPQPTLTDEERAALMWFSHYGLPERRAASLRKLLARLK